MRRTVLLGVVAVALAAIVAVMLLAPDLLDVFKSKTVVTDQKKITTLTLGFVGAPYPDDYNVLRIPGWIENRSGNAISSAKIEIQLLDRDGNRKELVRYEVEDIAPHTRKSFNANASTFTSPRTAKIKVTQLEVEQ